MILSNEFGAASVWVGAVSVGGFFNEAIELSVQGLPAGASAGFDNTTIFVFGGVNLWIVVGPGAAPGTYPVLVTGTGGGIVHSRTVMLTVT